MPEPLDLLLATRNDGKVEELRALLADLPVRLHTLADDSGAPDVVEDQPTLEGNARKKAETLAAFAGMMALADDTGLEVKTLEGRPGVRTARFAGEKATSEENRRKLLRLLEGRAERAAQFRTVAALATPEGSTHCVEGRCRGHIAHSERGTGGFGYDAVFVPAGSPGDRERTFAEMSANEKNALSHRRRALDKLRTHLQERLRADEEKSER